MPGYAWRCVAHQAAAARDPAGRQLHLGLTTTRLKLDPTDAEWSTFITYVVAAFQEGDAAFGKATLKLLAHVATLGTTMDQAVGQLLAELGRAISTPTVLIVDDLQHVQGNAEVRGIIERL